MNQYKIQTILLDTLASPTFLISTLTDSTFKISILANAHAGMDMAWIGYSHQGSSTLKVFGQCLVLRYLDAIS